MTIAISKELTIIAKPFLKWAGGKTQLIPEIIASIHSQTNQWDEFTYIEPFVGAGAILFAVLDTCPNLKRAIINDINPDLINAYKVIQSNLVELIQELDCVQTQYYNLNNLESQKLFFLQMRNRFNNLDEVNAGSVFSRRSTVDSEDKLLKTALFLFLNKTCFNGLYRVNSQGLFNVPFGKYKKPKICHTDNLIAVHHRLQNVEILKGDFSQTFNYAEGNTLFYFDPPYKPIKETSAFTSYTKEDFTDEDQRKLKAFSDRIHQAGHQFILSNSDVKNFNSDDHFFDDLYQDYHIQRVKARRNINSQGNNRGEIFELLITNFKVI